jgi:hypothetical protein
VRRLPAYFEGTVQIERARRAIVAVAGVVVVVLIGLGLTSVFEVSDWIGIVVAALLVGTASGTIGVWRTRE